MKTRLEVDDLAGLGVVEECGPEVKRFQAGQRVVCVPSKAWSTLDGSGSWQQVRGLLLRLCNSALPCQWTSCHCSGSCV